MYLPKIYESFKANFPEIFEDYSRLGVSCREKGPLDRKTQDLVKLGISIGSNSRGAVMSHTRKALASGASKEEITQTVLLSLTTTGFPNMIAALGWVQIVLEDK